MGITMSGGGASPTYRSLMMFIDGGYLRNRYNRIFKHDKIHFLRLSQWLSGAVDKIMPGLTNTELIRIYYYDAIVDHKAEQYTTQRNYFNAIEETPYYEVKLGRLIHTGSGDLRQKGVDVLLAIDMISKAYLNHYDIALLLAGDDDYLDVVKSVKEVSGKKVFGTYFHNNTSESLIKSFDQRIELTNNILGQFKD